MCTQLLGGDQGLEPRQLAQSTLTHCPAEMLGLLFLYIKSQEIES